MQTREQIREEIYATLVGVLLIIFFALMIQDIHCWWTECDAPTDTNVEMRNPPELECNDPHGYYCDQPTSSVNL